MLLTLVLSAVAQLSSPAAKPVCDFDKPTMLNLGVNDFDQDLKGGWRVVARQKGCEDQAAELIRQYRRRQEDSLGLLYWHEGQLRASLGQVQQAVSLLERSKTPNEASGWNAYVDATIAFLVRDEPGLLEARRQLLATPRPPQGPTVDAHGKPRPAPKWPLNIDVVNALVACFGKTYDEAYGSRQCRELGANAGADQPK
jgi:hypothetical protein